MRSNNHHYVRFAISHPKEGLRGVDIQNIAGTGDDIRMLGSIIQVCQLDEFLKRKS